jgi:hypothetical protein
MLAIVMMLPERLLDHRRQHGLGGEEGALEVDVLHALPLFDGQQVHGASARNAGRRHEHVDAPELFARACRHGVLGFFVTHVDDVKLRPLGRRRDLIPLRALRDVAAHDERAFVCVALRTREADPRRGTGDYGDLPL